MRTENAYGKLDVVTCHARQGIAEILSRQCKYPEAEQLLRQNLEVQLDNPAQSEPQRIALAYNNLGCMLGAQSQMAEAEACFHQAYDRRAELFGRSDARSMATLARLADVVAEQRDFHYAEELYLQLGETLALPQSDEGDSEEGDSDEGDSDGEDSNEDYGLT